MRKSAFKPPKPKNEPAEQKDSEKVDGLSMESLEPSSGSAAPDSLDDERKGL